MQSVSACAILASAGSGKTTLIARAISAAPRRRTAVTTFTVLNCERLRFKIAKETGGTSRSTTVLPWFTFLLQDLVRPYQHHGGWSQRVEGVNLVSGASARYAKKTERRYWFDSSGRVYSDKVSEFALRCDDSSGGAVLRRLRRLYEHIYIDELQDLAGADLDLVERMIQAGPPITMVGDPRQGTYSTNQAARNRKYRGAGIADKLREWERRGLCKLAEHAHSYRCPPAICRLADLVYPDYPATESRCTPDSPHVGAHIVRTHDVLEYLKQHRPQVLRHDKNAASLGVASPLNFGASKGLEFDHVLIVPTEPIRKWISTGERRHVEKSLAKLYVAITRASISVAFVHDGVVGIDGHFSEWNAAGI